MFLKLHTYFFIVIATILLLSNDFVIAKSSLVDKAEIKIETPDTIIVQKRDSSKTTSKKDTIKVIPLVSKSAIDAKITYSARDSIRFNVVDQLIYLYGDAEVQYKDINLKAAYIELNMQTRIVFAEGIIDSLGRKIGRPVFKEGAQVFTSEKMTYNFKTKKGRIIEVITKEGEGYLHGNTVKKQPDNSINVRSGKYTTCSLEHPHFYIDASKLKVIPHDKIITGPAYLVIEDVPTPLMLPFGFFPNQTGARSGVLIPTYGESSTRGFYLQSGGYFFAVSDHVNASLTGDIYTNGSWGAKIQTNYKTRYKNNGYLQIYYNSFRSGETGIKTGNNAFSESSAVSVEWKHTQDPKANPNGFFSAWVKAGTNGFTKAQALSGSTPDLLTNEFRSSIAYQTGFFNHMVNLSTSMEHYQNNTTHDVRLTLPSISLSVARLTPFKSSTTTPSQLWYKKFYQNVGVTYTASASNALQAKDSTFFKKVSDFKQFNNGLNHSISINTTTQIKYFSINPSFNLNDRMYTTYNRMYGKTYKGTNGLDSSVVKTDTLTGFKNVWDYNVACNVNTKIYGMVKFNGQVVKAIRHVIIPTIGYSWRPDFSESKYGYYSSYSDPTQYNKQVFYSYTKNGLYGTAPMGKSGMVNFSISNNLELKVRNRKDTIRGEKKISLIDDITISSAYNMGTDLYKWQPINISGRTRLFGKLDIAYSCILSPYVHIFNNTTHQDSITPRLQWDANRTIGQLQNASWKFGLNYSMSPNTFKKSPASLQSTKGTPEELEKIKQHPEYYVDFNIPWNFSVTYSLSYGAAYFYPRTLTDSVSKAWIQTLSVSGDLSITPKWKVSFTTGWDFQAKDLSYTNLSIIRDLHCWELKARWVPFGITQSYSIDLKVKSAILQDLKLSRKSDFRDNIKY